MDRKEMTAEEVRAATDALRSRRRLLLEQVGIIGLQKRVVDALARIAELWRDPEFPIRRRAERENAGFPFPMVWVSLEALLDSLHREKLWDLIRDEDMEGVVGVQIIGHVIAANTPLLAWTSLARALLVGSGSVVKLPTHPVAAWADYFVDSLAEIDPALANLIRLIRWKGGTSDLDRALCAACDRIIAYGSERTIEALGVHLTAGKELIGYGHRVSFGVVSTGSDMTGAARGFARDVLLYDQAGCLSPHTLFVEGGFDDAAAFSGCLARALEDALSLPEFRMPDIDKDRARAAKAREQRALARMEPGTRIWEDAGLRWSVVATPASEFRVTQTHGMVYIAPLNGNKLIDVLAGIPYLQGAAVASASAEDEIRWRKCLEGSGVSYISAPGELQRPPLSWRENAWPVLRTLCGDYRIGV